MSDEDSFLLGQEQRASILRHQILPGAELELLQSHRHPSATLVVSRPGASAHGLVHLALRELQFDGLSISDEALGEYHPHIAALRAKHPYTWSDLVRGEALQWANALQAHGMERRLNLVIDMPTEVAQLERRIRDLFRHGYRVEIRLQTLHRLEGSLAMSQRFSRGFEASGCGRYVVPALSEAFDAQVPAVLDSIYAEPRITIQLLDWKGKALYDSRTNGRLPSKALSIAQDQRMKDPANTKGVRDGWATQAQWEHDLPQLMDRMMCTDGPEAD